MIRDTELFAFRFVGMTGLRKPTTSSDKRTVQIRSSTDWKESRGTNVGAGANNSASRIEHREMQTGSHTDKFVLPRKSHPQSLLDLRLHRGGVRSSAESSDETDLLDRFFDTTDQSFLLL